MTISEAFNIIENEIWKQYPLDSKYYISSYGRVLSVTNLKKGIYPIKKQKLDKDGYYTLNINHGVKKRVHSLVAITFLNHTPQGMKGLIINHINGIKTDNRVENLELVTNRYKSSYAVRKTKKTSKYCGVYFNKENNKYIASIRINYIRCYLGDFKSEEDAALRYNIAYKLIDNYTKENAKNIKKDVEYIIKNNMYD